MSEEPGGISHNTFIGIIVAVVTACTGALGGCAYKMGLHKPLIEMGRKAKCTITCVFGSQSDSEPDEENPPASQMSKRTSTTLTAASTAPTASTSAPMTSFAPIFTFPITINNQSRQGTPIQCSLQNSPVKMSHRQAGFEDCEMGRCSSESMDVILTRHTPPQEVTKTPSSTDSSSKSQSKGSETWYDVENQSDIQKKA